MDAFQALLEHEDCEVDAVTKAGVTPLMNAVESGNIQLVVLCLNEKLNPFLKDALDKTASDYAQQYQNVMGYDMRNIIHSAMTQWRDSVESE